MSDEPDIKTAPSWKPSLVSSILVVGASVLVIAFLLSAIERAREAALRSESKNNLKQIGLALHNYHDTFATLPPGGIVNADGVPYHCWTTSLDPYLWSSPWYSHLNFSVPWDAPSQLDLFINAWQPAWQNPRVAEVRRKDGLQELHYAANSWVLYRNSSVTLDEVGDIQNTLLIAEARGNYRPRGIPGNWRDVRLGLNVSDDGFGVKTSDVTLVMMADGSVRAVSQGTDPAVWNALAGESSLRPSMPELERPAFPSDISQIPIWRYRWIYFSKLADVRFRLSPDGSNLSVRFPTEIREAEHECHADCRAILRDLEQFGGIQHITITGAIKVSEAEALCVPKNLKTLTLSTAKVEGDLKGFRQRIQKSVTVD